MNDIAQVGFLSHVAARICPGDFLVAELPVSPMLLQQSQYSPCFPDRDLDGTYLESVSATQNGVPMEEILGWYHYSVQYRMACYKL